MDKELIRPFLKEIGVSDHVVEGGLSRLKANWLSTVSAVIRGEPTNEYDYLNDMDGRDILDQIEQRFPGVTDTRAVDERFLAAVKRSDVCLWGAENAANHGWTPDHHWWYFHEWPSSVEF